MSTDARVARHFSGARSLAPRLCAVDDSANVPDRTRERDARANASSPRGHGRGRCRYRSRAVVTHRNFSTALFRTRESCDNSRRFGRGRREPSPDQSKYPHERNAERNRNARPETRKFDESNPPRIRARWSNDVDVGCTKRAFPKCSSSSLECSARESPSSDVLGVVDPPLDHSTSAMASASASDADGRGVREVRLYARVPWRERLDVWPLAIAYAILAELARRHASDTFEVALVGFAGATLHALA